MVLASLPKEYDLFEKIKNVLTCPDCKETPSNIAEEFSSGDMVCMSCGLVVGAGIVDTRSEWRTFSNDDSGSGADPNRVGDGGNPLLIGGQLHTRISDIGDGSATRALSRTQKAVTTDRQNEKLTAAFRKIDAFCAAGHLNSTVVDASKHILKEVVLGNWFTAITDELLYAVIYHGCKRTNFSRTINEIGRIQGSTPKKFNKYLSKLNKRLVDTSAAMYVERAPADNPASQDIDKFGGSRPTSAKDLMPRFCQVLELPVWAESLGVQIAEALQDTQALDSRAAPNICTTTVYILCHLIGQPRPLEDVYCLSGLGKATIVRAIRIVYQKKDEILNNQFWPNDNRINRNLFNEIINFSAGISSKRKRLPESEFANIKAKSQTPETDSQEETSGGSQLERPTLNPRSRVPRVSGQKIKATTSLMEAYGASYDTNFRLPDKCAKNIMTGPFQYGKGFPPPNQQTVVVWNGLYLPGPM